MSVEIHDDAGAEALNENGGPTIRVREISFRSSDPNGLADLLEKLLGLTKVRHVEEDEIAILTDGYLQIGIRSTDGSDDENSTALDHLGIQVDDVEATCEALLAQGWTEAPNSQPATRFVDGPARFQLEVRSPGWGWDDVIRATTQLYALAPVANEGWVVRLPDVDGSVVSEDGCIRVGRVGDVPAGGTARVEVAGEAIMIVEYEGSYYALQDACPHLPRIGRISEGQRCGRVLECPIHRSRFDLLDGRVLEPPARQDLRRFDVAVRGDDLCVKGVL